MADADPGALAAEAPGWRRGLAGLIDGAAVAALVGLRRRLAPPGAPSGRAGLALVSPLLRSALLERVGSPGERAMGVRTVDRRTGRPVELWRALVLTLVGAGVHALRPRLMPPSRAQEWQREQDELAREAAALRQRHAADPDALNAAMIELWRRRRRPPVGADASRILAVSLAFWLASRQLQRRLAPTVVVRRRRADHSP